MLLRLPVWTATWAASTRPFLVCKLVTGTKL